MSEGNAPRPRTPHVGARTRRGRSTLAPTVVVAVAVVAVVGAALVMSRGGDAPRTRAADASGPAAAAQRAGPVAAADPLGWGGAAGAGPASASAPAVVSSSGDSPADAAPAFAEPPPPPAPVTVTVVPGDRDVRFPADSGIVDVKRDFGAKGDGLTDDTAAIQTAIAHGIEKTSRYASPAFVYFPRGVYIVTDTLESRVAKTGWSSGWRAGMILYGQNRSGSVIRLKDSAPGYQNPASPKAIVATGSEADGPNEKGGGNRAFRHSVINLTVDAGRGNPGAIGIDYVSNNRGCIEDVIIRTQDAGVCGLSLERWWPGPAMVKRLTVEGFDFGIRAAHYQYGMTFEHVTLRGQKTLAIRNVQNVLSFRGLRSENRVPVLDATAEHGTIVIVDSEFSLGDAGATAITNKGDLFLRNVVSRGYGTVVRNETGSKTGVTGGAEVKVVEYASHAAVTLFDSPRASLDLAVAETPEHHAYVFSTWANASTSGLQAAIDSGAETVYIPNGSMSVAETIIIRGGVRRILGMQSGLSARKDAKVDPLIRFEGAHADGTILEHLRIDGNVEHASSRTLTFRHCDLNNYRNSERGTGALFLEDTIGPHVEITRPQRVWARQWNVEFGDRTQLVNRGGVVWILGFKTEVGGEREHWIQIQNERGAVEVLGAIIYPLGGRRHIADVPCFINDRGSFSATWAMNGGTYEVHVRERRGDEWRELHNRDAQLRGPALYAGYTETDARRARGQ